MKEIHRTLLPGLLLLPLAAALPLVQASRAQERTEGTTADPASRPDVQAGEEAEAENDGETVVRRLLPSGTAGPAQAAALQRARLERELVYAERSARMLTSFEEALANMQRQIQ